MHDLLNVRISSASLDFLEAGFYVVVLLHLKLHLRLQECAIKLLHHEVLTSVNFVLIFVLVGRKFCDLTLSFNSVHSPLKRLLLVLDGKLERDDSFLPLLLLVVDVLHESIESELALELCLSRKSVLLALVLVDLALVS